MTHLPGWKTACAVVGLSLTAGQVITAQAQEAVPTVSLREAAASLARAGSATGDARKVLAAAQILITAERPAPGLEQIGVPTADSARPEERGKIGDFTAAGMLRLASRIAIEQSDAVTARAAAEIAGNAAAGLGNAPLARELRLAAEGLASSRGATGGPIWADGFIGTGEVREFRVKFDGGYLPNKIDVTSSSAGADLDCFLYDGKQLSQRDDGFSGGCVVKWSQKLTGTMTMRIRNNGAGTYFTLVSN